MHSGISFITEKYTAQIYLIVTVCTSLGAGLSQRQSLLVVRDVSEGTNVNKQLLKRTGKKAPFISTQEERHLAGRTSRVDSLLFKAQS